MYICPVCGYDQLEEPPTDYNICESCGTEFGYHDANHSHAELRQRWIAAGMPWHNRRIGPPPNWDPVAQLVRAGYGSDLGTYVVRARHEYELGTQEANNTIHAITIMGTQRLPPISRSQVPARLSSLRTQVITLGHSISWGSQRYA